MSTPTSQVDLLALAEARHRAWVPIFVPTTLVAGEIFGDQVVLKNLAGEVLTHFEAAGHAKRQREAAARALQQLVEDDCFWRLQANSLAIYPTPVSIRTFRVPNNLSVGFEVSNRFLSRRELVRSHWPSRSKGWIGRSCSKPRGSDTAFGGSRGSKPSFVSPITGHRGKALRHRSGRAWHDRRPS